MQSVLRLMPEPLSESNKGRSGSRSGGLDEQSGGEFGSVYEQQLYEFKQPSVKPQSEQGGNDPQQPRQLTEDPIVAQNRVVDDSVIVDQVKQKQDSTQVAAVEQSQLDEMKKIEKSLDQLLSFMEQSDKLNRQTNGIAMGEPNGSANSSEQQSDAKPTIESLLVKDGGIKTEDDGKIKSCTEVKPDKGEIVKILAPTSGSTSSKDKNIDIYRTPGINPGVEENGDPLTDTPTEEHPTIRLTPLTLAMQSAQATSKEDGKATLSDGQKQTLTAQTNTVDETKMDTELDAKVTAAVDAAKVGADLTKEQTTAKLADGKDGTRQIQTAAGDAEKTNKPFRLVQNDRGNVNTIDKMADPHQTPGINPHSNDNLAENEQGKMATTVAAGEQLSAKQAEKLTTMPASAAPIDEAKEAVVQSLDQTILAAQMNSGKTEKSQFIGGANSKSESKTERKADNILGTSSRANMAADASNLSESAKSTTQQPVDERKLMETLLAQGETSRQNLETQSEENKASEELLGQGLTKPMATGQLNTTPSSFSAMVNAFSADNSVSANAATSKMAQQPLSSQLTEALNTAAPDFNNAMKEKLQIMMNKGVQMADIRLDPAELGQMQVKMSIENDITSVSFVVQNSQAKEVLEQALPKLREMLAEQGIEMGEGSVQQEQPQQQGLADRENRNEHGFGGSGQTNEAEIEPMVTQQVKIANGVLGGIDFFA